MMQSMEEKRKQHIAVFFGGRSGEHAVSLMSAASVLEALDPEKYVVTQVGITREGTWLIGEDVLSVLKGLQSGKGLEGTLLPDPGFKGLHRLHKIEQGKLLEALPDVDVVFPVLHGTFGEDGTLQGLFELAELAYVGPGVLGAALAMDKVLFKDVMRAYQIPVLESGLVLRSQLEKDPEAVLKQMEEIAPYPLFTKPANLGSSVGITKCCSRSDLLEGMLEAAAYDRRILVERGIESAREIEVSVLGNDQPEASVPGEIVPSGDFYSYESKYHDSRSELKIPAPLSEQQTEAVRSMAVKAYRAIDCAGLARVDFLMEPGTEMIYINEINTIPGFTAISMYPKLWEKSGLPYPRLLDRLIELALERKTVRDNTRRVYEREA